MDSNLMEECSYQWVQSAKCHIWSVMIFESTSSSVRDHATCCNIISAVSLVLSASRLSALDILFFPWREFKGWEGLLVPLVGTISCGELWRPQQGWGALSQFPPSFSHFFRIIKIWLPVKYTFIVDRHHCSWAAVMSVKYECGSKDLTGAFAKS